jgi:2-polyprenyl-6-methoxyphenol hydroxylase-like FAD-dependent oxidoreductase
MEIIIVGAGIAGLTAALSLHQAGFRPTVYEAVSQMAPLGVGINILPHAMREFSELGLLDDLVAAGVEIDELAYLTKHGKEIWKEPRGLAAGYKWPQVAIHRGELQMLLLRKTLERLGQDSVRFGHALADLETNDDGVTAHFVDRATGNSQGSRRADLLVAADGIHSAVRRKFYPDEGMPKWNGITLWRSTSRTGKVLGGRSMLWAGHARQKFVAYPIKYDPETGETLLNWICDLKRGETDTPAKEDWNKKGDRDEFLPPFAEWRWPGVDVPELVEASSEVYEFPMVDRDPLPRWTFGRTTLLGDAAHPMYPIGSNGATQGVIDARVFTYHLATAPSIEEALSRYEEERRAATSRIVLMNRANGPDQVMELAEQRAPNTEDDLDAAVPYEERKAIADGYKKIAGFDPQVLNNRMSYSVPAEASRAVAAAGE